MACRQCRKPLSFGLINYCSNECQEEFHISNGTDRAKEFRNQRNAKRVCWDWNRNMPCKSYCQQFGWRHACQVCGADCAKGQGLRSCASCAPANWPSGGS